jgi:Fic family protein
MTDWHPITPPDKSWRVFRHDNLHTLARAWTEARQVLANTNGYSDFMVKLRRQIAIETGVIERLYTMDRGVTLMLIESGIDASLIPHGKTDKNSSEVVALIRDQESALGMIFDFVGQQRSLSTSFIKQLHQLLTKNQDYTEGIDSLGRLGQVTLIKGDWKRLPNNPTRPDGSTHTYCPPEQVVSQMDELIRLYHEQDQAGVAPEVQAAWLHHRFTEIHPFQDGNGRVARLLASLVFIQAGWFPLVVLDEDEHQSRLSYIKALEQADGGNLQPLVNLFARAQQRIMRRALSLAEEVKEEAHTRQERIRLAAEKLRAQNRQARAERVERVTRLSDALVAQARERLATLQGQLSEELRDLATVRLSVDVPQTSHWYRQQIVWTARQHDYFAYLNDDGYRHWSVLSIMRGGQRTEILLSWHFLGRTSQSGVIACSACAWQRSSDGEDEHQAFYGLEKLADDPFTISDQDMAQIIPSYEEWLEAVIDRAVEYWTKTL